MGCRGWSRIDVMTDAQGNFRLVEVNTNPGMTSQQFIPLNLHQQSEFHLNNSL